jgi:Fe-S-cluster containining protein
MREEGERQSDFFDICDQCSIGCCQNARPPLTVRRRQIIEEYFKEQKFRVENPFTQEAYAFPREDTEGYCIFYDKKTRRCQIHSVKPETCVAGPITFDINVKNKKIEWCLKMEKICSLAGAVWKNGKNFEKHLESARKEILRLVSELDPQSLRAILKIDEPETFKIGEENLGKDVLDKLISEKV